MGGFDALFDENSETKIQTTAGNKFFVRTNGRTTDSPSARGSCEVIDDLCCFLREANSPIGRG